MKEQNLTLKDLQKITGVPAYLIQYLKASNRLIITQPSKGRGYSTLYDPDSIQVIKDHLVKKKRSR